jgi:hypothetical protein
MINNDILEATFNLSSDAIILLNTALTVTKLNKTAELMLNISSVEAVGK